MNDVSKDAQCTHCGATGIAFPEKCCLTCKYKRIAFHTINVCKHDGLPIKLHGLCGKWELDAEGVAAKEANEKTNRLVP